MSWRAHLRTIFVEERDGFASAALKQGIDRIDGWTILNWEEGKILPRAVKILRCLPI